MLATGGIEFLKKSDGLESYDRCIFHMQVMLQLHNQKGGGITDSFLASEASVKLSLAHQPLSRTPQHRCLPFLAGPGNPPSREQSSPEVSSQPPCPTLGEWQAVGDEGPAAQGLAHLLPALHCPSLCWSPPPASPGQELQTRAGRRGHLGSLIPRELNGHGTDPSGLALVSLVLDIPFSHTSR